MSTTLATLALIGKLKKKRESLTRLVATTFGVDEPKLAAKLARQKGSGAAPVLNSAPLPDFNDIYYHPDGYKADEREREAEQIRRKNSRDRNRQKFGLHGTSGVEPGLRFDPEDYVLVVRAKRNDVSVGGEGQNNTAPTPPKVEGRETSGTRYVISDRNRKPTR